MRKLAVAAACLFGASVIFGQTANTIITGTYTSASGPNPSGTLTITWSRFLNDANPRAVVFPGRVIVQINNGVIPNVSLFPNSVAIPTGGCYSVSANLNGVVSQRYWFVPVSATPVNVNVVEGSIACSPGGSAIVSPGQIAPGPPSGTTVLTSSASGYVAWLPGGGSGGSPLFSAILSGTNTSAAMLCGTGCSLGPTGSGSVAANQILTTPITALLGNSGKLVQGNGVYTPGDLGTFDSGGNLIDGGIAGGNVLLSTGTYANPSWLTSLSAAKLTTGTLPCAALPATTGDVAQSAGSCATLVLSTNNTPFAPSATTDTTNAINITSGTLPSARLPAINLAIAGAGGVTGNLQAINVNGGTNADTSHFLRGDMTWQLIAAGGTVTHSFGPLNAGAVVIGNSANDINVLATLGLSGQTLHANPIGSPTWAQVNLTTDVTGVNPGANGGTGTAFLQFAGPTALRTYTGPDANATLLTSANAVTLAQGGLGGNFSSIVLGGMISGSGSGTLVITPVGANSKVWTANSGAPGGADWETAAAGGTITAIVFSSPLTGGTITASGTAGCPTCVTSAASLTTNQLVIGSGSQGTQTLGSLGTTTQVLIGGTTPSWGAVNLAAMTTGLTPLANGGLNANLTASNGGIFYSTASAGAILSGTATANQVLLSGASSGPVWSTATYPATTTANQILYSSSNNVIAGLATAANGVFVTNGSSVPSVSTSALPFANLFPSGTQTQSLKIKPNAGNNTTIVWSSPVSATISDYNFPAVTPTGSPSLTAGSRTVTFPVSPLGVNGSDTNHSLYVSGGTGTAEAVPITAGSCTELGTACTLTMTFANSHSGAYAFTSASAGVAEAIQHACTANGGGEIYVPAGNTYAVYAPIYFPCAVKLSGQGMFSTILVAQAANTGVLDISGVGFNGSVIEDIGFNTLSKVQGTSGGYAIRLGNGGGNQVSWVRINRIYCEPFYDCILAVNASQYTISQSVFYNFSHTGVTVNDTTNNDYDGSLISQNEFYNYNLSAAATACVLVTSTGALHITDNNCQGASMSNQLNAGIVLNSTVSSQMTITSNLLSTFTNEAILLEGGVYNNISITGNNILFPTTGSTAYGILANGSNTTNVCVGLCQITITGNTMQGPGTTGSGTAIYFQNYLGNVSIGPNSMFNWALGFSTNQMLGSGTVTVGPQNMENVTVPFNNSNIGATTRLINTAPITFASLPGAANGSVLYVSDSNSTCTAGSSTGQMCNRVNGGWSH